VLEKISQHFTAVLIAQLLACLRDVKMSVGYKQDNFVISRMNEKEKNMWSGKLQSKNHFPYRYTEVPTKHNKEFFFS